MLASSSAREFDITKAILLQLKRNGPTDFSRLVADLPEVKDVHLVIHFKLDKV